MSDSILKEKSFAFALRIVKLCRHLTEEHKEFALSRKILDSGTAIGTFIEEAMQGESREEFIHKLSIANKEAFKTNFLLRLLRDSDYLTEKQAASLLKDCEEMQKLLISSLKTSKGK